MTTQAARLVYNNSIKSVMKAFGLSSPGAVLAKFKLTQSSLRLELPFVTGNNQFNFNILVNQAPLFNTEIRLELQDSFVLSSMGFFVAIPASGTDNTFVLQSYLNPTLFTVANANAQRAVYNSTLELAVNRNILIPEWDMWKHWSVPQTQQLAATTTGDPIDQLNGAEDGFYPVEPNITLIGSKNTQISLNLNGPGITAFAANSRLILLLRGILVQNSTPVS